MCRWFEVCDDYLVQTINRAEVWTGCDNIMVYYLSFPSGPSVVVDNGQLLSAVTGRVLYPREFPMIILIEEGKLGTNLRPSPPPTTHARLPPPASTFISIIYVMFESMAESSRIKTPSQPKQYLQQQHNNIPCYPVSKTRRTKSSSAVTTPKSSTYGVKSIVS